MISRSNSRKSGHNSSGGSTLRERMQIDPFVRKKTVRYIAIIDQGIAGLLLFYAAFRLVSTDFKGQSLIVLIGANQNIFIAMIYWLGVFSLIGLQLVIAFLLLTATKDMTTDPETMIKKCNFWRTFSFVLLVFLFLDLFISIYIYAAIDQETQRIVSVCLDAGESIFRLIGIFIVGKFITDLNSIFANPMMTRSNSSSPVLPHISRTSSINAGSASCSRTQSMNYRGDGSVTPSLTTPRILRTSSMSVDILPKFSRTPSISIDHPSLNRTTSLVVGDGSVGTGSTGRGSRNSEGPVILNLDDGL